MATDVVADDSSDDGASMPDDFCAWLEEHGGPVGTYDVPRDSECEGWQPCEYDVQATSPGWEAAAAESLAHNGFCVVRAPALVAPSVCEACLQDASCRLDRLFACARQLGLRPRREVLRYSELCSRTPGGMRFDMRLWSASSGVPLERTAAEPSLVPPCWTALQAAVESYARPVLQCYIDRVSSDGVYDGLYQPGDAPHVDSVGCVTALPGAPDQHFHPDGTAVGLVNTFVPLRPVTLENGPTELRPGSHVWNETALGAEPRWEEGRTPTAAPLFPEPGGAMLLFDYRCYHRGRANFADAPRPVGYVAFSTRATVTDAHNFPSETSLIKEAELHSATPE